MAGQKKKELNKKEKTDINWIKIIARFVFTTFFMGVLLFLSAGRLDWWEGWVYLIYTLTFLVASRTMLFLKFPEMANERMDAAQKENVKSWDTVLVPLIAAYLPMIVWITAGLDVRFGWSQAIPDSVQITAFVVNFAASLFSTWAMFANQFFSSHVRIQTDRGHTVTRSGPYRFMRHPGYAGAIISWIATFVFFGSIWAVIPVVITITGYVFRTALEDRTLQEELPGYREYTQEVRYRLFPGIW